MISDNHKLLSYVENNHPNFLLIPFRQKDIFKNERINANYRFSLLKELKKRYPNKYVTLTSSGRMALGLIFKDLKKKEIDDKIFIQTTSDNKYISKCVTDTIEGCSLNWNRENNSTDISLINHEFGYVDNRVKDLKKKVKVIIEDCAFSFNSRYSDSFLCGNSSQYSIFSFSKFFPIQIGGFLLSDSPIKNDEDDERTINYINNVVGFYFSNIPEWSEYRIQLLKYYNDLFGRIGCTGYFDMSKNHIPGVYLFNVPQNINLQMLKKYYWERGIQCSVFYGKKVFFLPLHQYIKKEHIEYFFEIFQSYLIENENK